MSEPEQTNEATEGRSELSGLVMRLREEAQDNVNSLLYKAADEIEELAWALAMFMDGKKDHDIPAETGLCDEDCERIAAVRAKANPIAFDA